MVIVASIPSGILVHNLLFLNEFPDVEADRKGGRKTAPVFSGMETAGKFFRIATISVYLWIIGCAAATLITGIVIMPVYCLISLLTFPFAIKAMKGSKEFNDREKLVPSLGSNVQFILFTQILIGIGYILETLFPF